MTGRDILAISISTVAFECGFSVGSRVISPPRSSLHAKTVEALMCLQNWMIGQTKGNIYFFVLFFKNFIVFVFKF